MNFFNPNIDWQQSNGGFPGAVPPGAGIPPMPPLFSESRRDCPTFPAESESYQSFILDSLCNTWCIDDVTNGQSKKRKPLTRDFQIHAVINVNDAVSGQLRYVLVHYSSPEPGLAIIPICDHLNRRYRRYFPGICVFPNCPTRLLNELIWFMIRITPATTVTLFQHHGFMLLANGQLVFASKPNDPLFPDMILPDSVRMRKLEPLQDPASAIHNWMELFGAHPRLTLLGLLLVASLLLYFLAQVGLYPDFQVVIRPSDGLTAEQLTAMLCLFDEQSFPIPSLEQTERTIREYLNCLWDGIALFHDSTFADEGRKIESTLRFLAKQCGAVGDNSVGRYIITVVSKHASYVTRSLPEGVFLTLDFDDVQLDADCKSIRRTVKAMEAVIVTTIQSRADEVMQFMRDMVESFRKADSETNQSAGECGTAIKMLCAAAVFLNKFLNINTLKSEEIIQLLTDISRHSDLIQTSDQAIVNEWAGILSSHIRSGDYTVQRKRRGMSVDPSQKIVFIDGHRLQMSDQLLVDILTETTTTKNLRSLISALKANGHLKSTDGDTHPFQSHDINNKPVRLYLYDIDAELLDAGVLHMLQNLDSADFWIRSEVAPKHDFVPLLTDGVGKIAGQQLCWQDANNSHVLVTGQSGAGKSFWLCQRAAHCSALDHCVILFDGSDSFSREEMCRNLPEQFVSERIVFHDIEADGIPVDLFRIERNARRGTQINILLGLLTAGVGPLSIAQSNTLRQVLSDLLEVLDEREPIRPDDILALLDEDRATYESLRCRLEPLFEEISEYGMGSGDWGEVLNRGHILVLRTYPSFSAKGNQLFDMIFASLYNFKRQHKETPLDLIVDEAQNQNFAENSPLRKLLKEGRSSRLSVCVATQDFYGSNTELGSAVGKAGLQVFFRPTNNSKKLVAEELNLRKEETAALDSMLRGEVIMKGSFYSTGLNRNNPAMLCGKVFRFGDGALPTPHHHITDVLESQDAAGTGGTDDEAEQ